MRAVVLRGFGDPEVLHVEAVEVPEPGPDQVRVTVAAAAVNPVDLATRAGVLPHGSTSWPLILGWDAAGTVSAVGREVTTLSIGQPVVGMSFQPATQVGTYAEHVALAAEDVAVRPDELTAEAAATIPTGRADRAAGTEPAQPNNGRDLVHKRSTRRDRRLRRLAGPARWRPRDRAVPKDEVDAARSLGVDLVLDRHREVTAQVKDAFPDGVDASLDVAGGATARAALAVTRDDGRYVTVAPGWWRPGGPDVASPGRPVSAQEVQVSLNGDQLRQLVQLMARGELKSRVAHRLPLEHATHAHELQAAGGLRGKIMLIPSLGQTP